MDAVRSKITQEDIIEASWGLLEKIGIDDFSMRKLAIGLEIQAPSIYWHFSNKQMIFQALANEVAKESLLSLTLEGDWTAQLIQLGQHIKSTLNRYPCSAQLLMRTAPTNPDYLVLVNTLLQIVDELPLDDKSKFSAVMCLLNYIIVFELDEYEQKQTQLLIIKEGGPRDTQALFKGPLAQFPDDELKVLRRMYSAGVLQEVGSTHMFQNGLQIVISGIKEIAASQAR